MAGEGATIDEDHPILRFLEAEVPRDPGQDVLVVAPSAVAAAALRRALTRRRGALLGVDFVSTAGLAQRILFFGGRPHSTDVPDPLEEREALRSMLPQSSIGSYARRFEGALTHLLETLRELAKTGPLARTDDLSVTGQDAVHLAEPFFARFAHRGGRSRWIAQANYALAGGQCETLPHRVLVIGHADPDRDVRLLLQLLMDRDVPVLHCPLAEHAPTASLHDCPHLAAELRLAAQRCLDAGARGVPFDQMVVAAPRLQPYLDHLRRTFDSEGVPFHTAAATPVIRHPRAATVLHIARLLFGGAPRPSFLALASSSLLRTPIPAEELARLERDSRFESLQGTGAETREFADRLAWRLNRDGHGKTVVRLIGEVVRAATADATKIDFHRRSELLEQFVERHLREPSTEDRTVVGRIEDCLRAIQFAGGDEPTGADYAAELEDLLRTRTVPLTGGNPGGVHVVSYHDALAIPCRHLHLLGLSADAVPGSPPLRTYLGDEDRDALHMRTSERAREAETELLGHLARHGPELTLSFSRTDADGRPREVTHWLDRLAQHATLPEEATFEPGHPEALAQRVVATGRCAADLALEGLALGGCDDPKILRPVLGADATRVLARLEVLESFDADSLQRDGDVGSRVGAELLQRTWSVTAVQGLGRCPQQFLFERVMKLAALPEEPDPLSLPRDKIGTLIHTVIEKLYEEFLSALRDAEDPTVLGLRMAQRAGELLEQELERDTSILRRQFPGLHDLLRERWLAGLVRAIEHDLVLMEADGSRPDAVEMEIQQQLRFRRPPEQNTDDFVALHVKGKLDRIDRLSPDGRRVLDFKTGRRPESVVDVKGIYKGTNLQLILYAFLVRGAEDDVPRELEVRAVRPIGGPTEPPKWRHRLTKPEAYLRGDGAEGTEETLAILARLLRRGLLAPKPDRHCSWCSFKAACRRFHPPSSQRVSLCTEEEWGEYRALAGKSRKRRVLSRGEESER